MKAVTTAVSGYRHSVTIGKHQLVTDEPAEHGGEDSGPSPEGLLAAALAGCTAITLQMYAGRKEWDLTGLHVSVDYENAPRGETPVFEVELTLPAALGDEQIERLAVIAGKCPIRRTLTGDVIVNERVTRSSST